MNRGNHRAPRMRHDAHAGDEESERLHTDTVRADPLGESGLEHALHRRSIDTGLLVGGPTGEDPAETSTAARPLPTVFLECAAPIQLAEESRCLFVQALDPGGDPLPEVSGRRHPGRHSWTAVTNACA